MSPLILYSFICIKNAFKSYKSRAFVCLFLSLVTFVVKEISQGDLIFRAYFGIGNHGPWTQLCNCHMIHQQRLCPS